MTGDRYAFRQRFNRWKQGERYWSIIGQPLPHYADGKDSDLEYMVLPLYRDGKNPYKYSWDQDTKSWSRYTADPIGETFNNTVVTPSGIRRTYDWEKKPMPDHTPHAETAEEYTKRRIAEESNKRTWRSDAADAISFAVGFTPAGNVESGLNAAAETARGNYKEAAMLGAGMFLPFGLKKVLRPVTKGIKRMWNTVDHINPFFLSANHTNNASRFAAAAINDVSNADIAIKEIAAKHARKNAKWIKPTLKEKNAFMNMWRDMQAVREYNTYGSTLNDDDYLLYLDTGFPIMSISRPKLKFKVKDDEQRRRLSNLIKRNPEYYEFLKQEGILDPFSQESVSKFLDRQFTSVRGVSANNTDDAAKFLTETTAGKALSGGDRLQTHGGIYTSNSTTLANMFKNPNNSSSRQNGYIGVVTYPHNIDTSLPIEDLLELYRRKILIADKRNPLFGTDYYKYLRRDPKVVALESDYVGRHSGVDKSIQERAYLPDYTLYGKPVKTLDLKNTKEFKDLTDLHGRWGYGMEAEQGSKNGLFIPREMNDYSDFVNAARVVLRPKLNRRELDKLYYEAIDNLEKQERKREKLLSELNLKLRKFQKNAAIFGVTVPLGATVIDLASKAYKLNESFYDSPEYLEFLKDPNLKKYLDNDDGGLFKTSSVDRLWHKYKRKYIRRVKTRNNAE